MVLHRHRVLVLRVLRNRMRVVRDDLATDSRRILSVEELAELLFALLLVLHLNDLNNHVVVIHWLLHLGLRELGRIVRQLLLGDAFEVINGRGDIWLHHGLI